MGFVFCGLKCRLEYWWLEGELWCGECADQRWSLSPATSAHLGPTTPTRPRRLRSEPRSAACPGQKPACRCSRAKEALGDLEDGGREVEGCRVVVGRGSTSTQLLLWGGGSAQSHHLNRSLPSHLGCFHSHLPKNIFP